MLLKRLKPRAQGRDKMIIAAAFIRTAFLRLQPNISIAKAIIFSKTAITVDIAANDIKTKNKVPQSLPKDIELKIFGSVAKIRPGPCPGFTPNAKHDGKIINPAIKATKVSSTMIFNASPAIAFSFPM